MRRSDPPHLFALDCPGGALIVCETGRHIEYGGRDHFWSRKAKDVQPFPAFADANGQVKQLRDEQERHFGRPRELAAS
jgi:hypothetical protein